MAKPIKLPTTDEQTLLDELQIRLLTSGKDIARWNRLVRQCHYLKNADLVGEQLRNAQNELQQAQAAFDLVTGEPKPAGLTCAIVDEISKQFPAEQHEAVKKIMDKECGRTIPFQREAVAEQLEYIRLCVLRLSKSKLSELRKCVELANIDQRDVFLAAGPLMK